MASSSPRYLITGATRGIGRACAETLARSGARILVHGRADGERARTVAASLPGAGHAALVFDLEDGEAVQRAAAVLVADGDRLDGLVNNASLFEDGSLLEVTPEDWHRMLDVNTCAPMILGRELARLLPDGVEGDVIHVNDIHCLRPRGGYFSYTQSKALLHALTGNMALALAPRVRVNAVALGAVLPPASPPDSYERTDRRTIPLERFPTVADVASTVVFLLGCRSITGETIRVDGGQHLRGAP